MLFPEYLPQPEGQGKSHPRASQVSLFRGKCLDISQIDLSTLRKKKYPRRIPQEKTKIVRDDDQSSPISFQRCQKVLENRSFNLREPCTGLIKCQEWCAGCDSARDREELPLSWRQVIGMLICHTVEMTKAKSLINQRSSIHSLKVLRSKFNFFAN